MMRGVDGGTSPGAMYVCISVYLYRSAAASHASGGSVLSWGDDLVTNDWEEEDPFISSNV